MAESMGGDMGHQVLQAIQVLSEQVRGLGDRMDRLEARMARQDVGMLRKDLYAEILGGRMGLMAEMQQLRRELSSEIHAVRMELQLGLGHVHDRIERNNHIQLLRDLTLYRTAG